MKRLSHIFALALLATACIQKSPVSDIEYTDQPIIFAASAQDAALQTKSLIGSSNMQTKNNRAQVFDYLTINSSTSQYINKIVNCTGVADATWDYVDGGQFYWTFSGQHKFFGWFTQDATGSSASTADSFFGSTLALTNDNTLAIPSKTIDTPSDSFDFMYSDVITRNLDVPSDQKDFSAVKLNMKHLFSALSFGAENKTSKIVIIKKVEIFGLKNTNSANIVFSNEGTVCNYGEGSKATGTAANAPSIVFYNSETGITLTPKEQAATSEKQFLREDLQYMLMWPQKSAADMTPSHEYGLDEVTGDPVYDRTDPLILITYSIDGESFVRPVAFPKVKVDNTESIMTLNEGKKYHVTLSFVNKLLLLDCKVLPWDYNESVLEYSDDTAQADPIYIDPVTTKSTYLLYDFDRLSDDGSGNVILDPTKGKSIVDDNAKTVTMSMGRPVKARFRLNSPQGAEWMVDLVGADRREFTVEKLTSNSVDGTNCDFQIVANNTSPTRDYKVNVRITLRTTSGKTVSVDPVLQGGETLTDQYTIIQPKAL